MVEYFSDVLIMFPISSIDAFSISYLSVIYFRVMLPSYSGCGVYILILFTPDPLDPGFKVLSLMDLSLIFSIMRSSWSLDHSLKLPMPSISLALLTDE